MWIQMATMTRKKGAGAKRRNNKCRRSLEFNDQTIILVNRSTLPVTLYTSRVAGMTLLEFVKTGFMPTMRDGSS